MGINQKFLPASTFGMQQSINNLATWTQSNKMELNEEKTNYMIFTRSKSDFVTRLTVNGYKLDQVKVAKLLGVWVSEDLSWAKNCQEISRSCFMLYGSILYVCMYLDTTNLQISTVFRCVFTNMINCEGHYDV